MSNLSVKTQTVLHGAIAAYTRGSRHVRRRVEGDGHGGLSS